MSSFRRDVLAVLRSLEPGQVVTYGEVAAEAGYPGAARAVGNLLRAVPDVPWWRVVSAHGRVCPHAIGEATRRLAHEGIEVHDARVRSTSVRQPAGATMSDQGGRLPDGPSPVNDLSGDTVEEGVEEAAEGSEHGGVLRTPEQAKSGEAPVENILGDEDMTAGQVVEPGEER